ncbi:MAG: hypothetical protein JNK61_10150 [Bacteroidia bacterium]|nr:hypothetical protein [Bacteroidia bacterium]
MPIEYLFIVYSIVSKNRICAYKAMFASVTTVSAYNEEAIYLQSKTQLMH